MPEAIAKNDLVLPIGAVCDHCNQYLSELDTTLVSHPVASLIIQFLQLPGKRGRVRKLVGNVASDVHANGITIPCEEPSFTTASDGSTEARIVPLLAPTFDLPRFRRALHHVGLNALALRDGVERALDGVYDGVRQYVRKPRIGENWPFVQRIDLAGGVARDVSVLLLRTQHSEFPTLVLGKCAVFGVDLRNTGTLAQVADTHFPEHTRFVDPEYAHRAQSRPTGRKRYRVTIDLV